MKSLTRIVPSLTALALLLLLTRASALEPPRVIPHSAHIAKPMSEVFGTLKNYFSDSGLSKFNLVSADEKTGAIVAKQNGIDSARWTQWAACSTDPMHMIYQLTDAAVTVTVKLQRDAQDTTFATVSADFKGTYGLGQDQTTIDCRSTGALEDSILTVAGAKPSPTP
jgi:hypothetical protein